MDIENTPSPESKKMILPVLLGAAAAGAIAYFLCSDELKELRAGLSAQLTKKWDELKEKVSETSGQ